jgi:indolepyruvate ferredoxin oxidoreductase beta subunit
LIDALTAARDAGNIRTVNMVMTGALSRLMEINEDAWLQAMKEVIPSKYLEVNLRAFEAGKEAASTK